MSKPKPLCVICGDPVEYYELQDPPTCLYCEIKPEDSLAAMFERMAENYKEPTL